METTTAQDTFTIVNGTFGEYHVLKNGLYLLTRDGMIRTFKTRNSARKRITRERRGDFHR